MTPRAPTTRPDEVFPSLAVGDIVRTPKGALAVVSQIDDRRGEDVRTLFLCYPEDSRGEKGGWWSASDGLLLVVRFQNVKRICNLRAGVQKS